MTRILAYYIMKILQSNGRDVIFLLQITTKAKISDKYHTTQGYHMKSAYKLNLPSIDTVCEPSEFQSALQNPNGMHVIPINKLFRPQWHHIAGWHLLSCSVFLKNNSLGTLHTDDPKTLREPSQPPLWGINWMWQNSCTLMFWHTTDIDSWTKTPDMVGTYNIRCTASKPPSESYEMRHGEAWLVNASVPHQVQVQGKRWAFSARTNLSVMDKLGWAWPRVVESFQDLIVQ